MRPIGLSSRRLSRLPDVSSSLVILTFRGEVVSTIFLDCCCGKKLASSGVDFIPLDTSTCAKVNRL